MMRIDASESGCHAAPISSSAAWIVQVVCGINLRQYRLMICRYSMCWVTFVALMLSGQVGCKHRAHGLQSPTDCLRQVADPHQLRSLFESAFEKSGAQLGQAIDRTITWSSSNRVKGYLPIGSPPITDETIRSGLLEMERILNEAESASDFADKLLNHFEIFQAVGMNGDGDVLFTAYFAPAYAASYNQSEQYPWPLYGDPSSIVDITKLTRRQLQGSKLLKGYEIAWLANELDAYLVHVNGSAQLMMDDGSIMCVGHVCTNEYQYASLGKMLIEGGHATAADMSMQEIRRIHEANADLVSELMKDNDRFVFFEPIEPSRFPRSALGIPLTPEVSLATDRACFPPGALVLVSTHVSSPDGQAEPFVRFMVDQDTGGAIQGAGRADIYLGIGAEAGGRAGLQRAQGSLYYLLPTGIKH